MKKLSGLIILIFCTIFSFAQLPSFPNNISVSNSLTNTNILGSLTSLGYQYKTYPDTTTANLVPYLKFTPNISIKIADDIYVRNSTATMWLLVGGGNWTTRGNIGTSFSAGNFAGTTSNNGWWWRTNNILRGGIDSLGYFFNYAPILASDSSTLVPNTQWVKQQLYLNRSGTIFPQYSIPVADATGKLAATADFTWNGNSFNIGYAGFYSSNRISIHGDNGLIDAGGFGMRYTAQGGYPADASKSHRFFNSGYEYLNMHTTGIGATLDHFADFYVQHFRVRGLSADSTSLTNTGTTHMLTVDANGQFNHQTIPSGGGANLTGPITSVGNATSISLQTGTGTTFAMSVSPLLTGIPASPTAAPGTNTTQIATTAYADAAIAAAPTLTVTSGSGTPAIVPAARGDLFIDTVGARIFSATGSTLTSDFKLLNGTGGGGTVTAVSVATANGFSGTSSGGTTPAITLTTPITGILKGNGTAMSAAIAADFPTLNQSTMGNAATATNLTGLTTTVATLNNQSGTNTGDNAVNSLYSGLVSNATHFGDATGSTALTVVKINGTLMSGLGTGILKNTTGSGVPSIAINSDLPVMTSTVSGAVPTPPNNTTTFLRGDGTWSSAGSSTVKQDSTLLIAGAAIPFGTAYAGRYGLLLRNTGLSGSSLSSPAIMFQGMSGNVPIFWRQYMDGNSRALFVDYSYDSSASSTWTTAVAFSPNGGINTPNIPGAVGLNFGRGQIVGTSAFIDGRGLACFGCNVPSNPNSTQFSNSYGPSANYGIGLSQVSVTNRNNYPTQLIVGGGSITNGGSGYVNGTYVNKAFINGSGTGGTGTFTVSGGVVTAAAISNTGIGGYKVGDIFSVSNANLGGSGSGFTYTITKLLGDNYDGTITYDSSLSKITWWDAHAHINKIVADSATISGNLTTSSTSTLTLAYSNDYVFTGTTATYTLPAISAILIGRTNKIFIKNRGTGIITLNSNSGSTLYNTALQSTISIAAGAAVELLPDGTYFNILFNL